MRTVAGVFNSAETAQKTATALPQVGITRVNVLLPNSAEGLLETVPKSETEQPGMGAALGGLVGGAVGAAGGLSLGSAAATMLIPGVGPVLAMGMAAATLFGLGGVVGGSAVGAALESESTVGLPADELFVYKDALRRGRSVIFIQAEDEDEVQRASAALAAAGAESIDAAREQHWIGLRSAEKEHYQELGGDFDQDELDYRSGFEAAMAEPEEAVNREPSNYAYRRGYERGLAYCREQRSKD